MGTVIKLTLKSIAEKKLRFILTALSVLISIMFTVGVFIFTDSQRAVFSELSDDIAGQTDITVRTSVAFGEVGDRTLAAPIDPGLIEVFEGFDGVESVDAGIIEFNVIAIKDGEDIRSGFGGNGPNLGVNWVETESLRNVYLQEGRAPATPTEFTTNSTNAEDNDLVLGDTYSVLLPGGAQDFTLVGTFNFADPNEDKTLGANIYAFETETAHTLLNGGEGWDEILVDVSSTGDIHKVRDEIDFALQRACPGGFDDTLPPGLPPPDPLPSNAIELPGDNFANPELCPEGFIQVVTSETIADEQRSQFDAILNVFLPVLLSFAIIIMLVSVFVIYNTFTIVLGQRIKEIGLLRALGSSSRQIFSSIIGEAFVVGVVASGLGIAAGVGLAYLLRVISDAAGLDLALDNLVLQGRTVVVGMIVGLIVTLVSALIPAVRARKISPMAALRDDAGFVSKEVPRRMFWGVLLSGLGILIAVLGMMSEWQTLAFSAVPATILIAIGGRWLYPTAGRWGVLILGVAYLIAAVVGNFDSGEQAIALGAGALVVVVGVNLISPLFTSALAKGIGWPIRRVSRVTGKLASENAARSPRRTSTTAAALMIGLALVSTVSVVAESLKATFSSVLETTVQADWFICPGDCVDSSATNRFSPEMAERLAQVEYNGQTAFSVASFRAEQNGALWLIDYEETRSDEEFDNIAIFGVNFTELEKHIDIDLTQGSLVDAAPGQIGISEDSAEDFGVGLGDSVYFQFPSRQIQEFQVAAIYSDDRITQGAALLSFEDWNEYLPTGARQDTFVSALSLVSIGEEDARTLIQSVADDYPQLNVWTKDEFNDNQAGQINQVVTIVNVFLAIALLVAFIGIANTLALSVLERTRELGLLRAVGMRRKQMLSMVLWEGLIIAVFGGLLGLGLGVIFGVTTVTVVPDSFISDLAVPVGTLVFYLLLAGLAGLLCALLPAIRASRLNVLDAIANE